MIGGETSRSKMSGGETSRSKMSGAKRPVQKSQGVKRPGPKRLSPKRPGAKTLPESSLHDFETSSMIVTLPEASLWLWGSFIIIILIWFMIR